MEKREFLLTAEGAYSRYFQRKIKRGILFDIKGEPLSKNSMKQKDKESVQKSIVEKLKAIKKRGFMSTTKVCLIMNIYTNHKTPPHIHTIPKNYIDLLWKFYNRKIRRKKILLEDDKQIKYLSVRYYIGYDEVGAKIDFELYPFNSFIDDIRLAYSFTEGQLGSVDRFLHRIGIREDYNEKFNNSIYDYERLLENKSAFDDETFEILSQYSYQSVQEDYLKTQNLSIRDLYYLFCNSIGYVQSIEGREYLSSSEVKKMNSLLQLTIVGSPLNISLPSVPTAKGESAIFVSTVKEKMIEYRDKHRFINPLLNPVSIKVFYKPPVTKNEFSKDLDNIMRIIVPAFHEVFKPPVSLLQCVNLERLEDNIREKYETILKKTPRSIQHQITGYEIFEIPRENGDISEGFLSLVIADGLSGDAYSIIEKTIEEYYNAITD